MPEAKPDAAVQRLAATEVAAALRRAGHRALFAGGCVRDLLLGRTPKDFDVATDARPEQVRRLFRRCVEVGIAFGVMRVRQRVGEGRDAPDVEIEVATFRADGAYSDGRRPDSVTFTDARTDAERRDFTVNGMFLDPESGEVIDYVGGRADLAAGLLRAIGDPEKRFDEDRLRMLRAVRFATVLGFSLDPGTASAVRRRSAEIIAVSGERIRDELSKVLAHRQRLAGLRLAWRLGLLGHILPETHREYTPHRPPAPSDADSDLPPGLAAAVAALPPDAPWTVTLAVLLKGGPETFADAAAADLGDLKARAAAKADVAAAVCERLATTKAERTLVDALVRRQWDLDGAGAMDLAAKKRLFARPEFPALATLYPARTAEFPRPATAPAAEAALALWRSLTPEQIRPAPLLSGNDLIALGVKPGPQLGRIIEAVYDGQLRGELTDREGALAAARGMIGAGLTPPS
jgi:poly(A) polymerase